VVVTEATKGVGQAIAERFARDGASVALLARGRKALAGTQAAVGSLGGNGAAAPDRRRRPGRGRRGRRRRRFRADRHPDHNAMTTVFSFFDEIDAGEFRRATEVTYLGTELGADRPRTGNLFEPVERDPGAHGGFGEQAHRRSAVLWIARHRRGVLGGAVAARAAAVVPQLVGPS
jgi:NAD(P)-dependent dehydrogenase (short-subunit alcohol dehydrogenase family)